MADNKIALEVDVNIGDLDARLKKVEGRLGDIGEKGKKAGKEVSAGFTAAGASLSTVGGPIGAAATAMNGFKASVTSSILALKSLKVALLATGLGAFLVALGAVAAAFKDSEEGQNKFNKLMAVLGAITGNVRDLFADLGEKIIHAVENPVESLKTFGNLIKENLSNRLEGLFELIPQLGKAVELLFEGQFAEAGKVAIDATAKVGLGVENITEKTKAAIEATKEFIEVNIEEGEAAARMADMRARADKLERELLVKRAQQEARIAELRLKARQEDKFSAEERKAAITEATQLQEGLLVQETKVLELRRDAQILENSFARSNKENLDKEAELRAKVFRQQTARQNAQRMMQRELNTVNNQIAAEEKARIDELNKKRDEAAKHELEILKQLADAKIALIQDEEEREIAAEELKLERKLARIQGDSEKEKELRKALEDESGLTVQGIRDKYNQQELDAAKKTADEEAKIQQSKFDAASGVLGAIGDLVAASGEQSKEAVVLQKAIAVAQIAIDTAKAVSGAIAQAQSVPYPANLVAIATGVAAVIGGIASAVTTLNSAPIGGATAPAPKDANAAIASAQAPSVAQVSTSTTELAGAQQAQLAPIQAFVVETEVTGNQNNINQIESQATFGG